MMAKRVMAETPMTTKATNVMRATAATMATMATTMSLAITAISTTRMRTAAWMPRAARIATQMNTVRIF
jgi:hypothetical protein